MNQGRSRNWILISGAGAGALALTACGGASNTPVSGTIPPTPDLFDHPTPTSTQASSGLPDVIDVSVNGSPGHYSLPVTISSPDIGCEPYADRWEAISEEGELLTQRVLLHAHVEEQPFTRSVGGLHVQPGDTVIIRGHMSVGGNGGSVMRGTVADGFATAEVPAGFAADLESRAPLPGNCAF